MLTMHVDIDEGLDRYYPMTLRYYLSNETYPIIAWKIVDLFISQEYVITSTWIFDEPKDMHLSRHQLLYYGVSMKKHCGA